MRLNDSFYCHLPPKLFSIVQECFLVNSLLIIENKAEECKEDALDEAEVACVDILMTNRENRGIGRCDKRDNEGYCLRNEPDNSCYKIEQEGNGYYTAPAGAYGVVAGLNVLVLLLGVLVVSVSCAGVVVVLVVCVERAELCRLDTGEEICQRYNNEDWNKEDADGLHSLLTYHPQNERNIKSAM